MINHPFGVPSLMENPMCVSSYIIILKKKHLYPIMDDNIYTSYSCHTPIAILFFTAPKKIDKICQCFALGRLGGIGRARGPAGESWWKHGDSPSIHEPWKWSRNCWGIDRNWLVVWLPSILFSHWYWVANHPNWLIFFRWVAQPPTRRTRVFFNPFAPWVGQRFGGRRSSLQDPPKGALWSAAPGAHVP